MDNSACDGLVGGDPVVIGEIRWFRAGNIAWFLAGSIAEVLVDFVVWCGICEVFGIGDESVEAVIGGDV